MTVFATGVFDLLHVEHVRFLKAAKKLGDKLVVGIESDVRVGKLKGKSRPMMCQEDRKEMLEALSCVDKVMILPELFDTRAQYEKILKEIKANVYAVSSESPLLASKQEVCRRAGVAFKVVHQYNPEYSTTRLVEKICL